MNTIAFPIVALVEANLPAVALVFTMALFAAASMGLVIWGLRLEARSNREWRERRLAT